MTPGKKQNKTLVREEHSGWLGVRAKSSGTFASFAPNPGSRLLPCFSK